MLDTVRTNPKSTIAATIAMIALVTGIITLDDRYCKAKEKEEMISSLQKDIAKIQSNLINFKIMTEVTRLQDKIFELNMKKQTGESTPVDGAMLERYRAQLRLIQMKYGVLDDFLKNEKDYLSSPPSH